MSIKLILVVIVPFLHLTTAHNDHGKGDLECPGSPSSFHAWLAIDVSVVGPCEHVREEIIARVHGQDDNTWDDPHGDGKYSLVSSSNTQITVDRVSSNERYTDRVLFTLRQEGAECKIMGCSESQGASGADQSTNLCNSWNLVCTTEQECCGVLHDFTSFSYTVHSKSSGATSNDDVCLGGHGGSGGGFGGERQTECLTAAPEISRNTAAPTATTTTKTTTATLSPTTMVNTLTTLTITTTAASVSAVTTITTSTLVTTLTEKETSQLTVTNALTVTNTLPIVTPMTTSTTLVTVSTPTALTTFTSDVTTTALADDGSTADAVEGAEASVTTQVQVPPEQDPASFSSQAADSATTSMSNHHGSTVDQLLGHDHAQTTTTRPQIDGQALSKAVVPNMNELTLGLVILFFAQSVFE